MLPNKVYKYVNILPDNDENIEVKNLKIRLKNYGHTDTYINGLLFSQKSTSNVLNFLNVKSNTAFYELYLNGFAEPEIYKGEELFSLEQILENYQSQNWINLFPDKAIKEFKEKYPNAGERYLQFTSIEGEGSYFYDKETDYVYNVDWGQEENMITGKLKPWFTSFYDFLEWYYSEDE
ncbi:hypothetical protein ACNSOL_09475 [Aliarcobacter lanthieri]|uniref:hypothetical protein n=1 Tax=Aliarcobacter lanthieri TaxID=1355374 RepID=UPI003AAD2643